jgi:aldehyde:ferredoxin oxidoreductase
MEETVIFIDGDKGKVQIEDASQLPSDTHLLVDILAQKYGSANPLSISIVSAGLGAEHTLIGCLNFSWYDAARKIHRYKQAGRGGIGTVLRDKKVKAIVAKYSGKITVETNGPAEPELLKQVGREYNQKLRSFLLYHNIVILKYIQTN